MTNDRHQMKLKVRKHRWKTVRTIDGKVKRKLYTYTIAVRKYGLFWFELKFHIAKRYFEEDWVNLIVNTEKEVVVSTSLRNLYATHFTEEADAIRVKLDIISHPDKYVNG